MNVEQPETVHRSIEVRIEESLSLISTITELGETNIFPVSEGLNLRSRGEFHNSLASSLEDLILFNELDPWIRSDEGQHVRTELGGIHSTFIDVYIR